MRKLRRTLASIPTSGSIKRVQMLIFPRTALLFILINSVILGHQSGRVDEFLSGRQTDIAQGTFIATNKPLSKEWSRIDPLLHAASLYGLA
ncbi:hypothetical protein EG832_05875 [bacterium]|nr:hypothetical protein [bacterium]